MNRLWLWFVGYSVQKVFYRVMELWDCLDAARNKTHSMNAYPLKPAVCYLAPGTPATETLFGTLIPIGPDPVPVWSTSTSIRAGLVVCETPIGWLHVPTGQGFLLAIR